MKHKNPVFVSWDGSSHDRNQHEEIIKAVDVSVIKAVFPTIFPKLQEHLEIPTDMYNEV